MYPDKVGVLAGNFKVQINQGDNLHQRTLMFYFLFAVNHPAK